MRPNFRGPKLSPGLLYLVMAGLSSALIYAAILFWLPLLSLYIYPIRNLNHMQPSEWPTGLLLVVCVILLFGSYGVGVLGLSRAGQHRLGLLMVVGFPLIFVALLLLIQPITSTDLYDYLFRGRMLARYQANPFVALPQTYRGDPLFRYVAWPRAVTAYGPLWEGMSWLTARLAGEAPGAPIGSASADLPRLLFAYKGLSVLGFLICGAAIWGALGRVAPERRRLGLYLWLWNPFALWETVAAGHNDVWMALLIVLALWALCPDERRTTTDERRLTNDERPPTNDHRPPTADRQPPTTDERPLTNGERQMMNERRHPAPDTRHPTRRSELVAQHSTLNTQALARLILSLLALTLGGLIKFIAFFFGPVLLIAELRRLPTWRARWRLVLLGGVACAACVALAYAPLWAGWETLRNIGDRRSLYTASWLAGLYALLKPAVAETRAQTIVSSLGLLLLLIGVCWACWRAWRTPRDVAAHVLWLMLWFLFLCNPWFQPWYVIWTVAIAVLQPWRTQVLWGVLLLCYTSLLSYVVGGLLLPALGLPEASAGREFLISALIYGPPLIVLGWGNLPRPSAWWRLLRRLPRSIAGRRRRGSIAY